MSTLEQASGCSHGDDGTGQLVSPRGLIIVLVAFVAATLAATACGTHVWTHVGRTELTATLSASCVTWVLVFIHMVRSLDRLVTQR
jgi:hypothetical protein